jgi:hypothetical protein
MAFLDNSGDIILDAVLTDAGRARLAAGDGSFKIVKYAFADDEIDYSKYDKNNASGSAYYDLNILTTPVLEAFTNNTSLMKSKLISIPRTNLLYLPILAVNEVADVGAKLNAGSGQASGSFAVSVDQTTDDTFAANPDRATGVFFGVKNETKSIQIDQGLATDSISKDQELDASLVETHFILEMDNRLGTLQSPNGTSQGYSFLDDDNIAAYNISNTGDNQGFFVPLTGQDNSPLAGPRGVAFKFRIRPSLELQTSNFLFTKLGTTGNSWTGISGETFSYIDTIVRLTGATTGYKLSIPVRFIKQE